MLFISHSSKNGQDAIRVRDWLRNEGWTETFLDLDPEQGLAPGQRWQEELRKAGELCSGVIVLISPEWAASRWCQAEFLLAYQLGKKIFPVIISETAWRDLPLELVAQIQMADVSSPDKEQDGFERLRFGLKRAGLHPKDFPWPPPNQPHRPLYRGLRTLEESDAAIFFGRDTTITSGLDTLRRMRDGARERMLMILGASGAGKSSFLCAGLVSRLKRDRESFLVLPVWRPERLALTGPSGLAASLGVSLDGTAETIERAFAALRNPVMDHFSKLARISHDNWTARPPTIVLPIDQGEELFAADQSEASEALQLLANTFAADPNFITVITLRSDAFAKVQVDPHLSLIPIQPFSLPPLTPHALKDVIEGPGNLAKPPLRFEPDLTDRLIKDIETAEALPLLTFTLEKLARSFEKNGSIKLSDYEECIGGLEGAVAAAVASTMEAALRDPTLPNDRKSLDALCRELFIPWLVRIDNVSHPKRRIAQLSELPEDVTNLVAKLVDERLLLTDTDEHGVTLVEVTHEAIFYLWGTLGSWIADERDNLLELERVRTAAAEWRDQKARDIENAESWLLHHGARLEKALALAAKPEYARLMGIVGEDYLANCRVLERQAPRSTSPHLPRKDPETLASHLDPEIYPKRILSIDGGGVKALLTLGMLQVLESELRRRANDPYLTLSDYFDLVGGTQSGAVIAGGIALGMQVSDLTLVLQELLPLVFRRRTGDGNLFRDRYDQKDLRMALSGIFARRTMGSGDIKTGLALFTKRVDTGMLLCVTNNPRSRYYETQKQLRLIDVILASAAIPTYFTEVVIELACDSEGAAVDRGYFIDGAVGGVSNPSVKLLLAAILPEHGFNWRNGAENLMMASCGSGMRRPTIDGKKFSAMAPGFRGIQALSSMVHDTEMQAVELMEAISSPKIPWRQPVSETDRSMIVSEPVLDFQRLDVVLDRPASRGGGSRELVTVERILGRDLSNRELDGLDEIANGRPENLKLLLEIGGLAATSFISERWPDPKFDFTSWR